MTLRIFKPTRFYYRKATLLLEFFGKPFFLLSVYATGGLFLLWKVFKTTSIKKIIFTGFAVFTIFTIVTFSFFLKTIYSLPPADALSNRSIDISTKIYDRNGILLYSIYKDKNRSLVTQDEIPQQVKLATLAAEDASFYSHKGFSIKGMLRAALKFITEGQMTGGSTITQQLIKNALLTPEKSILRKVRELFIAISVERKYTKDEILTMYLNEISYGGTSYGIKEAARTYFNKDLKDLSIAEAALLAGLTKTPTVLSPFGNNPERTKQRQIEVIDLMQRHGFITEMQAQKAKTEELKFANNRTDIKAPHFVMYVKDLLAEKYGEDILLHGGLEVFTTLDYKIQESTEKMIRDEIEKLKNLKVSNGAAIVINPQNGEILAMVGSRDYFDESIDGKVNVTIQPRQPGSSIKLINYAYALENKLFSPSTIIDDSPITFKIKGGPDYTPKNYDGKYRGKITLRSALAESRNIPAVKLLNSYGVDKMIELGEEMGITSWQEKNRFGLSLTLGGGEVKLIDLTQAYQVVANKGQKAQLFAIKKINNYKGDNLFENNCTSDSCPTIKVLNDFTAYMLTNILSDNIARSPAFGQFSTLVIKDHPEVAVKTGTSNDLKDNLTVGYNQNYLVSVWVGNNDNTPMSRVASGITGASAIWNHIMTNLLTGKESVAWETPESVGKYAVCKRTGVSSCGCSDYEDLFVKSDYKEPTCIAESIPKEDISDQRSKKNRKVN